MQKITSRRNPVCLHLKKLGASRSYRELSGEYLCDGIKLLEDASKSNVEIVTVLATSGVSFPLPLETRLFYTDRSIIDSLSPLKSAQNILFSCRITEHGAPDAKGTHILLDGLQDPGNVGAIIRTANAFGIDSVILTGGCADPYNPKAIRASMGAIFRQRFCNMNIQELKKLKDDGFRFVGADLGEGCKNILRVKIKNSLIAIGNEGSGLSQEVLSLCDERIRIPIAPECESLNAAVAAGIIIWKARA